MAKTPKKKNLTSIPVDRELALAFRHTLGKSLVGAIRSSDESGQVSYTAQRGGKTVTWRFNKDLARQIERKIKKKSFDNNFNLGLRALRTVYSMIYFSAVNGTGLDGQFTIHELLKLWGKDTKTKRGGQDYEEIRSTIISLGSLVLSTIQDKPDGVSETIIRPLFSEVIIGGKEGQKQTINYSFNKKALGTNADWLESAGLDRSVFTSGYLSLPKAELAQKGDPVYDAFRERVKLIPPGLKTYSFDTILNKWLFLSPDKLRRKAASIELITALLSQAKEEGLISGGKITHDPEIETWLQGYAVALYKTNLGGQSTTK